MRILIIVLLLAGAVWLGRERAAFKDQVDILNAKVTEKTAENEDLKKLLANVQANSEKTQAELQNAQTESNRLNAQHEQAVAKLNSAEAKLNSTEAELHAVKNAPKDNKTWLQEQIEQRGDPLKQPVPTRPAGTPGSRLIRGS